VYDGYTVGRDVVGIDVEGPYDGMGDGAVVSGVNDGNSVGMAVVGGWVPMIGALVGPEVVGEDVTGEEVVGFEVLGLVVAGWSVGVGVGMTVGRLEDGLVDG
jgi:hypothetical protein